MGQAYTVLHELYVAAEDSTISDHYAEFKAVLGHTHGRMLDAHMAEINLAMNRGYKNDERLQAALSEIDELLSITPSPAMDLRYTRANCLSAMRRDEDAIGEYERALQEKTHANYSAIAAQCWKNMGGSHARLGARSNAIAAYEEALKLDADLAEASMALAHCRAETNDFAAAAALVGGVVRRRSSALDRNTIQGWRAHYLSLAGSPEAALDIVLDLVSGAPESRWIWPWSANLVARIGRSSDETLTKALNYWRHYLHEHPDNRKAQRHRLLCLWTLRQQLSDEETEPMQQSIRDGTREVGLEQFRDAALQLIAEDDEAFWWDRIGHWAQADGDWTEAEAAYRTAHSIDAARYSYCLGTALNHLDRFDDAVPLLERRERRHHPRDERAHVEL